MPHKITIGRNSQGSLICDPEGKHVHHKEQVQWTPTPNQNVDHWAVVFGPTAPVDPKVMHPGVDTTTITAKRDFDPHKHKYIVLVWTAQGGVECKDPELIVDE